jgi:hypothetical protein
LGGCFDGCWFGRLQPLGAANIERRRAIEG